MKQNTISAKLKGVVPALLVIASLGITTGLIACHSPKQRPDAFEDDKSQDLVPIAEVNNKRFAVKTLNAVDGAPSIAKKAAAADATKTEVAILNPDNSLPIVEIETPATLLNNIPFKAVPNSQYEAMYRLEGKSVNVYKVGGESQIDGDEAKSGVALADAKVAIPMVSYPVTYIKVSRKVNADKEPTHQLEETVVEDQALATHVRIDRNMAKVSSAITNSKIIPAKFFEGQWLYKFSILGDKTSAPVPALEDMGQAEKVELKVTEDGINVSLAQDASAVLLQIPGALKDFEQPVALRGNGTMLSGKMTTPKVWSQKRFIKLQVERTKTVMSNEYLAGSFLGSEAKIVNFVITDNAISFDLEPQEGGMKTRFTIVRALKEKAKGTR